MVHSQSWPCDDLPRTGDRIIFKHADIRKAAQSIASLANNEGVLHKKRDPIALQGIAEDLEFTLEKPLSRGCNKIAQVWLTHLLVDGQHHPVVIKLYMGHYFECEKWTTTSTRVDFENSHKPPPQLFATIEQDAYTLLASAQGSIIPWSYGTHEFVMPWGVTCEGHIMEYIAGVDPFEYSKTLPADSFEAIDAFHNNCFRTFIEIHNRNVFHGDIRSSNMKLLEPIDPTDPKYVVLDFNLSGSIEDISSRGKLWADQEAASMMEFVALCNIDHWYGDSANHVWVERLCESPYEVEQS